MDLRSKLNLYKSKSADAEKESLAGRMPESTIRDGYIHENMNRPSRNNNEALSGHSSKSLSTDRNSPFYLPPHAVIKNDNGQCLCIENRYPLSWHHGGYAIGSLSQNSGSLSCLPLVFQGANTPSSLNELVFLDTETTGLSGGAGTVAFLAGIGCFEDDEFVLRQFFMEDYDQEAALLECFYEYTHKHPFLVTFNGKAFDYNLIKSRFIFNRMPQKLKEPNHFDLLYPSRKLWKLKLNSCSLKMLEEFILGETRTDDIPGEEIPGVYFRYLDNRITRDILRVIEHNRQDVITLVSLLSKVIDIVAAPLENTEDGYELYGAGRIYENNSLDRLAIECFKEACILPADKRLAAIYKKSGQYDSAAIIWEKLSMEQGITAIQSFIELSKHHEHRTGSLQDAKSAAANALNIASSVPVTNNVYVELERRINRLERKLEKNGQEHNSKKSL